ncbi:MAG: nucleoside hydrolase, partial [Caldilinea sp.]
MSLLIVATTIPIASPQPVHAQSGDPLKLIVDTDPGVDDALALTWLLSQRERPIEMLGIVSVFGNTTVEHTTSNVLTLLEINNRTEISVVKGAAAPLVQQPSFTGWFIHGPDGLWGIGSQHPHDIGGLSTDVIGFYCASATTHRGATILALGPLTNLANAASVCPNELRQMRVIVLGGAKFGGNKSALAEFNFFQDPEAVQRVLDAGIRPQIVPFDTFSRLSVDASEVEKLLRKGNDPTQFLAGAINQYASVQMQNGAQIGFPDLAAAVFAANAAPGVVQPALVYMSGVTPQTRGQSIVALSLLERLALIADDAELSALAFQAFTVPGFDLN